MRRRPLTSPALGRRWPAASGGLRRHCTGDGAFLLLLRTRAAQPRPHSPHPSSRHCAARCHHAARSFAAPWTCGRSMNAAHGSAGEDVVGGGAYVPFNSQQASPFPLSQLTSHATLPGFSQLCRSGILPSDAYAHGGLPRLGPLPAPLPGGSEISGVTVTRPRVLEGTRSVVQGSHPKGERGICVNCSPFCASL